MKTRDWIRAGDLKSMGLLGLVPREKKINIDLRKGLLHACESMGDSNKESFS
jgi:hypothetical protein